LALADVLLLGRWAVGASAAGNPAGCQDNVPVVLKFDQRGFPRLAGPRCDIGAVEGAHPLDLRVLLALIER
jgi:hypothetical protein